MRKKEKTIQAVIESFVEGLNAIANEPDRCVAIISAVDIEEQLLNIFDRYLIPGNSRSERFRETKELFGNFASKIEAAYRMGLISEEMQSDLHSIRKIRNAFAHESAGLTFEKQSVAHFVDQLIHAREELDRHPKSNRRRLFVYASSCILQKLILTNTRRLKKQ